MSVRAPIVMRLVSIQVLLKLMNAPSPILMTLDSNSEAHSDVDLLQIVTIIHSYGTFNPRPVLQRVFILFWGCGGWRKSSSVIVDA